MTLIKLLVLGIDKSVIRAHVKENADTHPVALQY